jgi:hypothetical protein
VDFTDEGRALGLEEMVRRHRKAKLAKTAAERAAELDAEAERLAREANEAAARLASDTA